MGEAQVESILHERMEGLTNPTLAPYAKRHEVVLRCTARAGTEEKAEAYKMAVCAAVRMATEYGLEPHASISIGSFSIGDTTPTGASGYQLAVQSALNFLTPAGLGFMGV